MKKTLVIFGSLMAPWLASAQGTGDLASFVFVIGNIVNILVPIVSTLAVVYFFYGLATFILSAGDEDKAKKGKGIMIWGVVAMFIIVTIFGIIGFMQQTIGNVQGPTGTKDIFIPAVDPGTVGGGNNYGGFLQQ